MYKIKAGSKGYYSDTLVYVKKAINGCYVPCLPEDAEYVVGKIPVETDDGTMLVDTVFEGAEVEHMDGGSVLANMQKALNILGVQTAEEPEAEGVTEDAK